MNPQIILAFDPGLANLGHSCLHIENDSIKMVDIDIHKQKSKVHIGKKLLKIYNHIEGLVVKFNPYVVAYEKMFFRGRSDSAASTIKVIGMIETISEKHNIKSIGVAPPTLKKFITGNGRADKEEMKRSVNLKLIDIVSGNKDNVELIMKCSSLSNHEIDAFGVALWAYDEIK